MNLYVLPQMLQMNIVWWAVLPSLLHSIWTTPKCFTQPQIAHYKDNKPNLIAFCLWNYVLIYAKCLYSALVSKIYSFSMHVDWVMWASAVWSEPYPVLIEESNRRQPYLIRFYANTGPGCTCTKQRKKGAPNNPYLVFFSLFRFPLGNKRREMVVKCQKYHEE